MGTKNSKKYKCPFCDRRDFRSNLIDHVEDDHEDMIPKDYTPARVVYNSINKKVSGSCMICHKETKWDEEKQRYNTLCENPKCRKEYIEIVRSRMVKKYGTYNLLKDPNFQKKMLENRSISGKYKFEDGGSVGYVGSYEKKFLEFMDKFLHIKSYDIISPGPNIPYMYKGKEHVWITDYIYEPYNLVFDIKDGGDNPNTRDMKEYREKQIAKEKAIAEYGDYNYIRLTDNNFEQLISIFMELKEKVDEEPIIRINESYVEEALKYDPPYSEKEVKDIYGMEMYNKLVKDPAHKYRMDTGIELIHREPSKEELERIWKNWNLMNPKQKSESDKKSIELFGKSNKDHYNELISSYNESYVEESSDKSKLDKNFVKKSGIKFKYIDIKTNKSKVDKYLSNDKSYNNTYKKYLNEISGEIIIDEEKDELAGYVFVINKFITPVFVVRKYRGYGLGDTLTKDAVKKYGAKRLWVYKDNEVAIKLYKKYGFKTYIEDDEPTILMATDKKYADEINESYVGEACKDLNTARRLCNDVKRIAKKYDANFFFVTDGSSAYSNGNGEYNQAAKEMRNHMDEWEKENGFNPDDDWSRDINDTSNYRLKESSNELHIISSKEDDDMIQESLVFNQKDIYYNKDKFDSGEINLCFITGHSGSGKSTMGRNMAGDKIEHYELDDVVWNKMSFTMSDLKKYGDLIYSFFNGKGKKYYYTTKDVKEGKVKPVGDNYEELLINDFINHSITYAKSHKDTKFVIEGVWLYDFIEPSKLKDYAVYIKGTSVLISNIRAATRDSKNDFPNDKDTFNRARSWMDRFKRIFRKENSIDVEKSIKKYRDYFSKLENINESYIENEEVVNENYLISKDDIYLNFDLWKKNTPHNILWVTGISGSGKSTISRELAKKYNAEYIELDMFTNLLVKGKDTWLAGINSGKYKPHDLILKYYELNGNLPIISSWEVNGAMTNEHDKLLLWLVNEIRNTNKLYIIDGAQLFMNTSETCVELIKGEPLVVKGTSALISHIRRVKRDLSNKSDIKGYLHTIKKDVPLLFKYYFSNEKLLQDFIKSVEESCIEDDFLNIEII